MDRRSFLHTSACATAGLLAAPITGKTAAHAPDATVDITLQQAAPEISPHLYGHFIEHLGGVIYDGVWVGPDSKIPNVNGIRRAFVEDMQHLAAPNLRWPGGCFADGYHWRDGAGNPAQRPRTYNYWQASIPPGYDHTETNQFGIHEFMHLCRLTGAQPYLAANMNSGSPQEFHDWVQYCNAPASTVSLAAQRAANGDKDPFGVRFWGVGNESWGCGGDMTPQEYAAQYRRFVTQYPAYDPRPYLVAVGPRGHAKDLDLAWTDGFFQAMQGHRSPIDGLSVHYYTDFRKSPENVATFDARGWYDVLREGARIESVLEQHWAILAKHDPDHRIKLVIDEWGVWYKVGEEIAPNYLLSQVLTLRDALHTAITLDVFNRHADKIQMANVAQTVNCIHALFLAKGDQYVRTPAFYVFEMYRQHMGAQQASINIHAEELKVPSRNTAGTIPSLSGSASVKGKSLFVTLTNPSLDSAITTRLRVSSSSLSEGKGIVLTHPEANASNTFEHPNQVLPAALPITIRANSAEVTIPARAVAALQFQLT